MQNSPFPELLENIEHAAEFASAFANENRLRILCALLREEMTVNAIAQSIGESQSATSQHLKRLSEFQLVSGRRAGLNVYYTVSSPLVEYVLSRISSMYLAQPGPMDATETIAFDSTHV
ncbi:ArsR family transcriptional regulator [Ochrobactrum sp. MYb29]|uniref:ArsR/SmtB family transcription factor n=1 Tax=Brucella pituitosa TaxID=571256 RepID=UPI000C27DF3C|nr:metalloregulator ArsR/SmtB family transcription factor [Brucella pituitosa]PJO48230.1 ArsR family transcriptional regulator [Brucella pituitosa]PRA80217.1 ArsR family transcriptional regulator [Ochrobactrum sp. MYb29]TCQ72370.1 DNA-binding transcriptional ArsR family regulator [Ochrobactrum sp. BH3]